MHVATGTHKNTREEQEATCISIGEVVDMIGSLPLSWYREDGLKGRGKGGARYWPPDGAFTGMVVRYCTVNRGFSM